jgi:hypothetical protein
MVLGMGRVKILKFWPKHTSNVAAGIVAANIGYIQGQRIVSQLAEAYALRECLAGWSWHMICFI